MADRVTLSNFRAVLEVKNGEVGSEIVLNRAVDEVKQELDRLWNWATSDATDTLPTTSLVSSIFNDGTTDASNMTTQTRTAKWIQAHISGQENPGNDTYYTWNISRIKLYIGGLTIDSGSWS